MKKTAIYILVAACVTMAFAFPAKTEEDQSCGPCPWHFKCIEGACTPQEKPGPGPNTEDTEELADLSTEEDQSCGPCPWHFKCIEGACTPQEKPGPGPNIEDTEELADLSKAGDETDAPTSM
ncbi:uncharacterized protein LOC5517578 isoform X1 [Nematostella vectensis]|uniref:uncharacterized protein LOC5517578 isoform X1 n=1 Tax=Nematostella vectensis TaxID=45351 RepID=UPI0020771ED3|nr:uncharacterized protein LOC5517578 isoform X1 [Nematostella vectensis]